MDYIDIEREGSIETIPWEQAVKDYKLDEAHSFLLKSGVVIFTAVKGEANLSIHKKGG